MARITEEQYELAYEYGKKVASGRMTIMEAAEEVSAQTDMNEASAFMYVHGACNMIKGIAFKRAINRAAAEYYLLSIQRDFGDAGFEKAISSLEQFVEYYENESGQSLPGMQKLIDEYKG